MMVRHGCGLEHDMPQQMPPATDGPFSTQCTAVMGNFTGKCHGQSARDLSEPLLVRWISGQARIFLRSASC